jgi:hypothetical protein
MKQSWNSVFVVRVSSFLSTLITPCCCHLSALVSHLGLTTESEADRTAAEQAVAELLQHQSATQQVFAALVEEHKHLQVGLSPFFSFCQLLSAFVTLS